MKVTGDSVQRTGTLPSRRDTGIDLYRVVLMFGLTPFQPPAPFTVVPEFGGGSKKFDSVAVRRHKA